METIKLGVEQRHARRKAAVGRLRREGGLPGVFYGPGKQAVPVSVDAREFHHKVGSLEGSHLIQFTSEATDLDQKIVLLKEIQHHPVNADPLHVDFYEVDVSVPVQVGVAVHLVGKCKGVTAGGTLQTFRREMMVECLPLEIPDLIEIDVTELDIHDAVRLEDVALPSGVTPLEDAHLMLASVAPPAAVEKSEEEEGEAAPEEAGAGAEDGQAEAQPTE